jgi:membrane protein DedA with SNARE-associated domain
MHTILPSVLSFVLLYGYAAIFSISYLAVFLPLPQTVVLLAGGAFAGQGYLNIFSLIFFSSLGNILGDLTCFILARKYGKELLMKIGLKKLILSKKFTEMETFINDTAGPTVFISRIIPLGTIVDILSGLSKMSFKKFMAYVIAGNIVYTIGVALVGLFLGNAWQNVTSIFSAAGIVIAIIIVIFALSRIYFHKLKHRMKKTESSN